MLLCDIGNTFANFLDDDKSFSLSIEEFKHYKTTQKVFFINVNDSLEDFLKTNKNFINLEPFFNFDSIYKGLGIDRIAGCYTIEDGVVVDAGSAITVDVIADGIHLGGFILPGLASYKLAYESISPRLATLLNTAVELNAYPQKTSDAISYGMLKSLKLIIKDTCKNQNLYFTGGDGSYLSKMFENAIYDKNLVFKGMRKLIEEKLKGSVTRTK